MNTDMLPAQEFEFAGGGRLFIAPTSAKDVVAVEGSILGGSNMLPDMEDVVPGLAGELLDAGTGRKKKSVIREALASRGISLAFSSSGDRTYFSGQSFPEDLPFLLSTIVECLHGANFPEAELKAAKARALGEIAEEKSDTRAAAERALSALLFETSHVNYLHPLVEEEKHLKIAKRIQLERFRKMLGKGGLILAITGDIDAAGVRKYAELAFRKLGKGTQAASVKKLNAKRGEYMEKLVPIQDKSNIDVLIGASLGVTKKDAIYQPLQLLTDMLGGSASSYLFQTIRERDGLTYGVYARLAGLADFADGYFKVWATFSPERYEMSVAKLREEIGQFFKTGITEDSLLRRQDEMTGSYLVSLSTTRGLARALHAIGVEQKELSYLTHYPDIIRGISLSDLKKAADLIPLGRLSLAASGTFPSRK